MAKNHSWVTLDEGIRYKLQNYQNSCFAAAYQNLCANLSSSYSNLFSQSVFAVERLEYDYMWNSYGTDIDKNPPFFNDIGAFVEERLNPLGYSINRREHELSRIKLLALNIEAGNKKYKKGYILNVKLAIGFHAVALFIKQISGQDHFICLDSHFDYRAGDLQHYAQPCSDGVVALDKLGLIESRYYINTSATFD